MKVKRPSQKSYITILLDINEHEKLKKVKLAYNKISNRKIFMAMVDQMTISEVVKDVLDSPIKEANEHIAVDDTVIVEEE